MKLLLLLILVATTASAQVPAGPPKPKLDRVEWGLLVADAAARGLDVYSTHWAECAGNKEATLPGWIANHTSVMALYSGGEVAAQYWVAKKLTAHHHSKWAHALTVADVSVTLPFAVHNLFLPVCKAPDVYTSAGCQVAH